MKNLHYKPDAVRIFTEEDQKTLGINSPKSEDLVWDPSENGGVLEIADDAADKILEAYPDDFEAVSKKDADQLQMTVEADQAPTGAIKSTDKA